MKQELDPYKLIDREAEQELFHKMLHFTEEARLLTISDGGGHGKSALLRRLEYNCIWTVDSQPYVSLIPLDQLQEPNEYGFVTFAREKLGRNAPFKNFDRATLAMARRNESVFSYRETGIAQGDTSIQGTVNAQGVSLGGSSNSVNGVYSHIASAGTVNINAPRGDWASAEVEKLAQQECVDAFLLDLRPVSVQRPVVLLIDAWERCNSALQQWIMRDFLRPHCFDVTTRPERLVLVLAGRQVPDFKQMLGLERYEYLIRSVSSLGEWNELHVKQFLEVHGFSDIEEKDVKYVCDKLRNKWSLQKALKMVEEFILAS